jgi:hypothetical protein
MTSGLKCAQWVVFENRISGKPNDTQLDPGKAQKKGLDSLLTVLSNGNLAFIFNKTMESRGCCIKDI